MNFNKSNYIFEFTDNYILLYNNKIKLIPISPNIIKNNKIYDIKRLKKIINNIIEEQKLINSILKTKCIVVLYEEISPSEHYLLEKLFNNSNIILELIYASNILNNHVFISNKLIYYQNKQIKPKNIKNKTITLCGYSPSYEQIKNELKTKSNNLIEYENHETILYEKI